MSLPKIVFSQECQWLSALIFILCTLEPFAVSDGVDEADQDEEESYLAVDSAYCGVTVNQPLRYGGESCQDSE